ncbi:MAG: VCBS repeat-containing protein [Chitinophagaceae bacterium]|nr:VCBS repeat-containing protein [Chitinophagaceae bacterium]
MLLLFALAIVYTSNTRPAFPEVNHDKHNAAKRYENSRANKKTGPLQFRKQVVAAESFESAGVFDVNNDSRLDIVSGAFWYEGPAFLRRHYIGQPNRFGEYYNDFSTIPLDVDGDGWMDFITGGWADTAIYWRKNPGNNKEEWKNIVIGKTGNIETARAWDIDGDGIPEIVPNNPGKPVMIFKLKLNDRGKGTGFFQGYEVWNRQAHGMGFGDINNDGRADLILDNGWLEAPAKPFSQKWLFHPEFSTQAASIPIIVKDINGDGKNDFIAGKAHDYGLNWYEQVKDTGGKRIWKKHVIDPLHSQFHTMEWEDLDNDTVPELITGKRYRAHNDEDPGSNDPIGLYYYQWNGESFTKQVISYGPFGEGKGTGIYFQVIDLQKDGRKDIIVAGKDGLVIFYNEGYQRRLHNTE